MKLGQMVGPSKNIKVCFLARIDDTTAVFLGRREVPSVEYVVSTFTIGEDWWHSGFYTSDIARAVQRFHDLINISEVMEDCE